MVRVLHSTAWAGRLSIGYGVSIVWQELVSCLSPGSIGEYGLAGVPTTEYALDRLSDVSRAASKPQVL